MTEHETCKGCSWNEYPLCKGIIINSGDEMSIDNLKELFVCGQKDEIIKTDFSMIVKSATELRIESLEERIKILEEKDGISREME